MKLKFNLFKLKELQTKVVGCLDDATNPEYKANNMS